jgi:hypothetical protein
MFGATFLDVDLARQVKKLAQKPKDVSEPTCWRLQATHIDLLINQIIPAEVCRHIFIILQKLAVRAPRHPRLFSLPSGKGGRRRGAVAVAVRRRRASADGRRILPGSGRRRKRGGRRRRPRRDLAHGELRASACGGSRPV